MEAFGEVSLSPDKRWLVYERRRPFSTAPRFDRGHRSVWAATDLFFVDLAGSGQPMRLIEVGAREGLVLGPWSPAGDWLLIYRVGADRMEAGVLNVASRSVHWTGLTPDMPLTGGGAEWRDADRLILSARTDVAMPWLLRRDGASQDASRRMWRLAAEGRRPSSTRIDTIDGAAAAATSAAPKRLMEIDARTGAARRLWQGDVLDLAVSPDGRAIAVLIGGEAIPVSAGPVRAYEMRRRSRLRLLDAASGAVIAAPTDDIALHLLRWSPRSDAVLVWGRRDGVRWEEGGLRRIDLGGRMSEFEAAGLSPFGPGDVIDELRGVQADWLGDTPVLRARGEDGRYDWFALTRSAPKNLTAPISGTVGDLAAAGESQWLMFGAGSLWRVTLDGAERLSAPDLQISNASHVSGMQALRFRLNAAPRRDWVLAQLDSEHVVVLGENGVRRRFDLPSMTGGSIIAAASEEAVVGLRRRRGAEALWLSRAQSAVQVDEVNAQFVALHFPPTQAVPHFDRFGRPVQSWLTLPPDNARKPLRGLVVAVYPGSSDSGGHIDPRVLLYGVRAPFLAGQGFAVLSPSIPVESGEALQPDRLLESVELAVNAALAAEPGLPSDRIAILGHSFGGTAALTLASSTRRFKTYIAWSAGTDFAGKWGEFDPVARIVPEEGLSLQGQMGWVETGQGQTGAPPWKARDKYAALSPYTSAWRIRDPVLLISADRDFVPLSQSERIFTTLHRTGVRARIVTYWGEGHFNWSPANIRDLYDQIIAWLEETLPSQEIMCADSVSPPMSEPKLPSPPQS